VERRDPEPEIARIAAERLVAADSRERDLDVARGRLRDDVRGNRRGGGERLVERTHDVRQDRADVGLEDFLVMVGREALRH